MQTEEEKEEV